MVPVVESTYTPSLPYGEGGEGLHRYPSSQYLSNFSNVVYDINDSKYFMHLNLSTLELYDVRQNINFRYNLCWKHEAFDRFYWKLDKVTKILWLKTTGPKQVIKIYLYHTYCSIFQNYQTSNHFEILKFKWSLWNWKMFDMIFESCEYKHSREGKEEEAGRGGG